MIIPPVVEQKLRLVEPYLDLVAKRVREEVQKFCESRGYAYLGRKKEISSLSEKIETGRFRAWEDMDDLFACTIVIPTLSEEQSAIQWLQEIFLERGLKRRGTNRKDPSAFRFDATRFCGSLDPDRNPSASSEMLAIVFEVQIRTAFEHAWSVTTHALAYKSQTASWRFSRLASQMKAAVEQLDQLIMAFEQNAAVITEHSWPELDAAVRVGAFFKEQAEAGRVPDEVMPASLQRFSENFVSLVKAGSSDRHQFHNELDRSLKALDADIRELSVASFPRSISMFQVCIGVLTRSGILKAPLRRFTPLISKELIDLYPECQVLGTGFDLQFNRQNSTSG